MSISKGELPCERIVDRDKYVNELIELVKNNNGVIIIKANTAIGKSCVVTKFIGKLDESNYKKIRIKTNKRNTDNSNSEWQFFNEILLEINNMYCNDTKLSFDIFIKKSKERKRWFFQLLSSTVFSSVSKTNLLFKSLFFILSYIFNIKMISFDDISNDSSNVSQSIKLAYFEFIMKKSKKMVLCIDNIQNIDENSMRYLKKMASLAKTYGHFLLLEYTTTNSNRTKYNNICENLKATGIAIHELEVLKIEKENIVDVVTNSIGQPITSCIGLTTKLVEVYERKKDGNIQNIIDYYIQNKEKSSPSSSSNNNTLSNILSLSHMALELLAVIINFGRDITQNELKEILRYNELYDHVITYEDELLNKGVITIVGELLSIKHASMIDSWIFALNNENNKICMVDKRACLVLVSYFEQKIKMAIPEQDFKNYLVGLLNLYSKMDVLKISELLQYMKVNVFKTLSIEQLLYYCEKFIEIAMCNPSKNRTVIFEIIKIYFSCELYKECFQCVTRLENYIVDERILLYKAMLYSALDKHQNNIIQYEDNIVLYKNNLYIYYNLMLIVLSSYRSLNQIDKCFNIDRILVNDKKFAKMKEYGYYLRLSEMYMSRDKSIINLKRSCKVFKKQKNKKQYGKSLISYAFVSATLGKLNYALKLIKLAEINLKEYTVGAHMFKVNKAAIFLFKHNFGRETWELLEEAEETAVVPFDKLAIIINKLVWCYENEDYTYFNILETQGLQLIEFEPDRNIHGLFYYNMYLLYSQKNNQEKRAHYYSLAQKTTDACKQIYARLNNKPTLETKFALKYKWHVCFLAYWTYDILDNDYYDESIVSS